MDHITYVGCRLDQHRSAALVRDTELLRRQAERASVQSGAAVVMPSSRHRMATAWHTIMTAAHLGHPVAR